MRADEQERREKQSLPTCFHEILRAQWECRRNAGAIRCIPARNARPNTGKCKNAARAMGMQQERKTDCWYKVDLKMQQIHQKHWKYK